jgi:hypothetical protein
VKEHTLMTLDPRRDPAWIEAATDDHEDALFYDTLSRRYEFYDGPLTYTQYAGQAEAERTAHLPGTYGDGPALDAQGLRAHAGGADDGAAWEPF